ncbi:MAG: RNA-binding cell elongation regulator Jag/EloR [Anaerolineales bacterium]
MKKTSLEVIAPTVEEAIARGAAELGLAQEELEVEVLDEGGKGFLGLSARQARVRLSVAVVDRPGSIDLYAEPGEIQQRLEPAGAGTEVGAPGTDPRSVQVVQDTVQELIRLMGLGAQVHAGWGPADPEARSQPLMVDVTGEDLGILIGRRGETLSALQYITRLIVAKELQQQVAVVIDIEGYRARREQQLQRLALKIADQAVEMAQTMELEPMPANERRVIHMALRDHPAVRTESVGEGVDRKVTIIPTS